MKGLISRPFIDDLIARTNIVDVIHQRVRLKKSGQNYQACCPFHHEKTPSFTVSEKKQFYYCFGCGATGNVISFLMNYDKFEFVEAVEELATLQGVDVVYEKGNVQGEGSFARYRKKRNLYELTQQVTQYYQKNLTQSLSAQAYLQKRGLSDEVIQRFRIGYAKEGFDHLSRLFGRGLDVQGSLVEVDLLAKNARGSFYDRFRHRIMFPIRNRRGQIVGFGGRVLGDEKPKYLNSSDTALFRKGKELYGLYEVIAQQQSIDYLLIVEGYMDVVALAQFGVNKVVASLGTATTPEQIQLAFRHTDQVICCYDGDRAGREAAWRALEQALPFLQDGFQLKFVFLPDGEDPDSYIRQVGKEGFEQYLLTAEPLSEFLFSHLTQQRDLVSIEGKTKAMALVKPLIDHIPSEALKSHLYDTLNQKLGVTNQDKVQDSWTVPHALQQELKYKIPRFRNTPMRILMTLLLQNPHFVEKVPDLTTLQNSNEPGFKLFCKVVELCQKRGGITTAQIVEYWRDTADFKTLEILASRPHSIKGEHLQQTFVDTLASFYAKVIDNRIKELITEARQNPNIELPKDKEEELRLLQELKANDKK